MRILIIGAGMSGLTAARLLDDAGHDVLVVDKGRAVGGRMASKRIGEARFDHGAQHFSVRTSEFERAVDAWISNGVVDVWYESESLTHPERGVERRHRGVPAMRSICEHLAERLDVRTGVRIARVTGGPAAVTDDGETIEADVVIVTAPVPQTLEMIEQLDVDASTLDILGQIAYEPTIAVMAIMESALGLDDGHVVGGGGNVAWISDNHHKGVSSVPAITIHSTGDYARAHLEKEPSHWLGDLLPEAERLTGGVVASATAHRWRYSMPVNPLEDGYLRLTDDVYCAGEALSHARIEGAFLSGRAVGTAVAGR